VAAGVGGKIAASPGTTTRNTATVLADLHEVEGRQFDQLIGDARASNSSAQRSAKLFLIAGLVVVLGAAGAAIFLGRRITGPLARLTDAANHLSTEQMPRLIETLKNPGADADVGFQIDALRPIEVRSGDEIGQLSTAFNEVQRVAGEVAAEQASLLKKGIGDMFVNLARRNQALLDRQIEFIDELERGEEDPDQLDNLYKLDHLATRMRRNAESLLVLAGAEPPRRRGRPAPLANVVRAALAEVEDFGRIELLSFDEELVASNAAADLAHLLSELMENATNFSPPETRVEVVGHRTNADGYVISVTDHGIGMSGEQIASANESLAKPPLVGLALSRSLGFIVVGRLSARHGIAVRMMPSASGGITAVVSLSPSLVVASPGGAAVPAAAVEAPARLKPVLAQASSAPAPDAPAAEGAPTPAPEPTLLVPVPWEAQAPEPVIPNGNGNGHGNGSGTGDGPMAWAAPAPAPAAAEPTAPPSQDYPEPLPEALLTSTAPAPPDTPAPGPKAPPRRTEGSENRPFFLEDAAPPRPFASGAPASPSPPRPPAPPPAKAPAAKAEPPRLFGGPVPPVPEAPTAAPAERAPAAPPVLATRRPRPPADKPSPAEPPAITPDPVSAPVPAPASEEAAAPPARTTTGLAKRVPRSAGGTRAVPGGESERGVSATTRAPGGSGARCVGTATVTGGDPLHVVPSQRRSPTSPRTRPGACGCPRRRRNPMTDLSAAARNINWLVENFVDHVPGVSDTVVVSADGLPMAVSRGLDRDAADRFAAVASGLIGLAYGAAGRFGGGAVTQIMIEMENAFLFVTGISDGSCLAVVAAATCDVGLVGYEMAVLVERAGQVLTPELRAELQGALPR